MTDIARLFRRLGLEQASYPKAEVKIIDEAPRYAKLQTEPKPTPTMTVEEARVRLTESMDGSDSSKITPDMYVRLCR